MPELIINKNTCLSNIERMAAKAAAHHLDFRPHFKTHQSEEIGSWFRDFGITRIAVSSFRMAAYFARAGWSDILVAFPFNPAERQVLDTLDSGIRISVLLDHPGALPALSSLDRQVDFYIDVDTGYGRTGMETESLNDMASLIDTAGKNPKLSFRGFYCHAGHSYKAWERSAQDAIHHKAVDDLSGLKKVFAVLDPIALYGDTPGCSIQEDFTGLDEITPGNFIFYDLTQQALGACTPGDIAVTLRCPAAGIYPQRQQIMVHGGAIHFSKDSLEVDGRTIYGQVKDTQCFMDSLSQEHGILRPCGDLIHRKRIGDMLDILPVHSCLAANLMRVYRTEDGQLIHTMNSGIS